MQTSNEIMQVAVRTKLDEAKLEILAKVNRSQMSHDALQYAQAYEALCRAELANRSG